MTELTQLQMNLKGKCMALLAIGTVILMIQCRKSDEAQNLYIPNNNAPYYDRIPTVLVKNYVNRLFIDLIGREPLDVEMDEEVSRLKAASLSFQARDSLIMKLQFDTTFREGDSSYNAAYFNRLYELFKVKMLEGASDGDILRERGLIYGNLIRDSLSGNYYNLGISWDKIRKLDDVLDIDDDLREDSIEVKDAFARLLDNAVYDRINMNTFNFLRASFNDLFGRYPTQSEFDNGFDIVEYNKPAIIFGQYAQNKSEYIQVLVSSKEFYEGLVRWTYIGLLSREPDTYEVDEAMQTFYYDHDLPALQRTILITDEYANFK